MRRYEKETTTTSGGIGFIGLLSIAFIVLKILDKISWPWIWVLAPIWISSIIYVLVIIGVILYYRIK